MFDLSKSDSGMNDDGRRALLDAIDRLDDPTSKLAAGRTNKKVALVMGAVVVATFVVMAVLVKASPSISAAVVGFGLVVGGVVYATAYPLLNYLMGVLPVEYYQDARREITGVENPRTGER